MAYKETNKGFAGTILLLQHWCRSEGNLKVPHITYQGTVVSKAPGASLEKRRCSDVESTSLGTF